RRARCNECGFQIHGHHVIELLIRNFIDRFKKKCPCTAHEDVDMTNSFATFSTALTSSCSLPLLAWMAITRLPSALASLTFESAASFSLRNVNATSAFSRASRLTMPAPMPRLPPVTKATFPDKRDAAPASSLFVLV